MARKRSPENRGLPSRWVCKHGGYYYVPPKEMRSEWDGKTWFLLGKTLPAAYKVWAERIGSPERILTVNALLDRFAIEEIPTKAKTTQTGYQTYLTPIRSVFGKMKLTDVEPQYIYQYFDKRSAKTSARREIEMLSAALTKAVQWGLIRMHPFKGQVRLPGETPRDRYIEDWEFDELMKLEPTSSRDRTELVQTYLRLKSLTALRQRDLLLIKKSAITEDGLHVTPSKTKKTSRKRLVFEWTEALRSVVDKALELSVKDSVYLFSKRDGSCFVNPDTESARSWQAIWQRFVARAMQETKITEPFTEHDFRAKAGSDAESLQRAAQLLAHADPKLTAKVYRRKPERIRPAR